MNNPTRKNEALNGKTHPAPHVSLIVLCKFKPRKPNSIIFREKENSRTISTFKFAYLMI